MSSPHGNRQYFVNIAWSWLGFAALFVSAAVVTPMLIRALGTAQFGIWALATSLVEYFWMIDERMNPLQGEDIDSQGFHAQAGYMVTRPVEVGFRFARIEGDTDVDGAALAEWRGVVGYFWRAHNLKLQGDAGQVRYGENYALMSSRARSGLPALGTRLSAGESLADTQVRLQFQVAF